ncbi:MAG: hypothetical protein ACI9WS_001991, partial [Paraglaciecola psychrophila]
ALKPKLLCKPYCKALTGEDLNPTRDIQYEWPL